MRVHPAALVLLPVLTIACGSATKTNNKASSLTAPPAQSSPISAAVASTSTPLPTLQPTPSASPTPQSVQSASPTPAPTSVAPAGSACPIAYPVKYSAITGYISSPGDGDAYSSFQPTRCYDTLAHAQKSGGHLLPTASPTNSIDTSGFNRAELEVCVHSLQPSLDSARKLVDTPTLVPKMISNLQNNVEPTTTLAALSVTSGVVDAGSDAFHNGMSCSTHGESASRYLKLATEAYEAYNDGLKALMRGFSNADQQVIQHGMQFLSFGDQFSRLVDDLLNANGISH